MTPDALLDSGELDLSVITARSRFSALLQVMAVMLRGRPAHSHSLAARSNGFRISAPAWVDLQLDGSAVKLKKYLNAETRAVLERAGELSAVRVNYRFDAVPGALRIAVPEGYAGG